MNYEGVIFDLDGVICSTDRYHYSAWKALADRLGIDFDERKTTVCGVYPEWIAWKLCWKDTQVRCFPRDKNKLWPRRRTGFTDAFSNL